jgi:hypothetical protein
MSGVSAWKARAQMLQEEVARERGRANASEAQERILRQVIERQRRAVRNLRRMLNHANDILEDKAGGGDAP